MRRRSLKSGPNDALLRPDEKVNLLAYFAPLIWPKNRPDLRIRTVYAMLALILAKIVTVLVPIIYKASIDWFTSVGWFAGSNTPTQPNTLTIGTLTVLPIMLIVAYGIGRIMMVVFAQIRDVLFTKVGQHAVRELANSTFEHLHKLSLRFHLERRTGGLSRVIERGTRGIELIIRMGVLNTIPTLIEMLFVAGMLYWYFGWLVTLIVFITVSLYIWFTLKASEWRIAIRRDMNDSDTEANSKAVDSLLNFETVKYFGNEKLESLRFDDSMQKYEQAAVKTYTSLGILNAGQAIIFTIGLTLCMLISADGVTRGTQTLGDFVMVNAILIQLYQPLNFMGTIYREIKQGLVDLENMISLLQKNPEIKDDPQAVPLHVTQGAIRFDHVSFSYDPERAILHDISFEVPPGKMVALVGPSGAGKSTISRLLFRFYDVTQGRILIDNQDIAKVTQDTLRAAIGIVPQDTVLFNDTILYNIRYGKPNAQETDIFEAAKLAQIDSFIKTLPDGYNTMVGERGLKLSGGEKQRVAIARTLLKGPPILMLDEATSALDSHTEKEIQDALDRVSKNRTTLVIAHRLSTIVHADEIIVLDKGQIVERGNHAVLMEKAGLYASMWNRQREAEEARQRLAVVLEEKSIN